MGKTQLQWHNPLGDQAYIPPVDVTRFRHGSKLHTAGQILQFPKQIYDFMKQGDKWEEMGAGGEGGKPRLCILYSNTVVERMLVSKLMSASFVLI